MSEPKIRLRNVQKRFPGAGGTWIDVLAGIDFEVREGEFLCMLGPSGCGKSTLLNMCGGFEGLDGGTIEIDGVRVNGPDSRRIFVFQEYAIFPWMNVRDNISFGLLDRPQEEQDRIVRHYVELVGLQGFERAFPQELSGGMRQRVAVARALAVQPEILLMDEPFGALDSLTRLKMRAELIRIWEQERHTILFVTHDVDESIQLADRVLVMTPRPTRISEVVTVGLAHPRDLGSPEYGRIKNRLYELLGVRHTI